MCDTDISLYGIRQTPCQLEGAGHQKSKDDSHEQEEISPKSEKEQNINDINQQKCRQM